MTETIATLNVSVVPQTINVIMYQGIPGTSALIHPQDRMAYQGIFVGTDAPELISYEEWIVSGIGFWSWIDTSSAIEGYVSATVKTSHGIGSSSTSTASIIRFETSNIMPALAAGSTSTVVTYQSVVVDSIINSAMASGTTSPALSDFAQFASSLVKTAIAAGSSLTSSSSFTRYEYSDIRAVDAIITSASISAIASQDGVTNVSSLVKSVNALGQINPLSSLAIIIAVSNSTSAVRQASSTISAQSITSTMARYHESSIVSTNALGSTNIITAAPSQDDLVAPIISNFTTGSITGSVINITSLIASDNVEVTGYKITQSSSIPELTDPGWTETVPASYTAIGYGSITLRAWARDAAGRISFGYVAPAVNISPPDSVSTIIEEFETGPLTLPGVGVDGVTINSGILGNSSVERQSAVSYSGNAMLLSVLADESEVGNASIALTFSGFKATSGTYTVKCRLKWNGVGDLHIGTNASGVDIVNPTPTNFNEITLNVGSSIASSIDVIVSLSGDFENDASVYVDNITVTKP